MKQLATLRYLLFVLLFASASACGGDDEKQADPQPTTHWVGIRMVGAGLAGLGAKISGGTSSPEGIDPQEVFFTTPAGATINQESFLPDRVSATREFYTTISFENVQGTSRAPAGSYLTAEILVDGQVKKTIRIDNTTAPGAVYVTARATILTSEW